MLGQPRGPVDDGQIEWLWLRAAGPGMIHLEFKHSEVNRSEPAARVWGWAVRMDDLCALPTSMKRLVGSPPPHQGTSLATAGGVTADWGLHQSKRIGVVLRCHSEPKNGLKGIPWNRNVLFYIIICFYGALKKLLGTLGEHGRRSQREPKESDHIQRRMGIHMEHCTLG